MMEELINSLNKINKSVGNKGVFVLHKEVNTNPLAKTFKIYRATLWYVINNSRTRIMMTQITTERSGNEDYNWFAIYKEMTTNILHYLNDGKLKEVDNGI